MLYPVVSNINIFLKISLTPLELVLFYSSSFLASLPFHFIFNMSLWAHKDKIIKKLPEYLTLTSCSLFCFFVFAAAELFKDQNVHLPLLEVLSTYISTIAVQRVTSVLIKRLLLWSFNLAVGFSFMQQKNNRELMVWEITCLCREASCLWRLVTEYEMRFLHR